MSAHTTPSDPGNSATDETWRTGWSTGRLLAVVLVIAVVWNLVGNLLLPGPLYVPANLAVAGVLLAIARHAGLDWPRLGLAGADVTRGLWFGLAAMAAIALAFAAGLIIPFVEAALEDESVRDASTFDRWFVPLVRIPFGTAVFEEILFRAVLLGVLLTSMPTRPALVVSSSVFGLWHIVPAWETAAGSGWSVVGAVIGTVALTSLGGLLFGVLRTWSRSVIAPILAHTATNSLAYVAAILAIEVID